MLLGDTMNTAARIENVCRTTGRVTVSLPLSPMGDPAEDFAPIVLVAFISFVLVVHPSLPVRSVPGHGAINVICRSSLSATPQC